MTFPGVPCIYYGDEAGCEGFEDPYNRGTYPWGDEDKELLRWYEAITTLRAKSKTLARGNRYPIKTTDDLLAYLRVYRQTVILCLFNRSDHAFVTLKHDLLPRRHWKGHAGSHLGKTGRHYRDAPSQPKFTVCRQQHKNYLKTVMKSNLC
ncbi:MAG: hypothetical protein ACOX1H_05340 [Pseudoramibacter sp.]